MLSQFQRSYQGVEQGLERLTESIAAYNPSTSAADELVAADNVVNDNLEQLLHQSNHLRIQELRQTAESLDQTLRKTIQTLAEARREILAIPCSRTSEGTRREVEVDELLAYAKFISRTTVPPTSQKKKKKRDALSVSIKREETDVHMTNGIATPPAVKDGTQITDLKAMSIQANAGDDVDEAPFIPWPAQDVIQQGALADVQRLIESGQDPGSVLTADEQALLDEQRKEEDERARLAQEEAERRRMSMFDTTIRRSATADVFDPDNL